MPAAQLLEQIREAWSASGNNELIINAAEEGGTRNEGSGQERAGDRSRRKRPKPSRIAPPANHPPDEFERNSYSWILQKPMRCRALPDEAPAADDASSAETPAAKSPADAAAALAKPAPVTINVTDDGRLMISSSDPVALDRMEELIGQLTPPERRFKVYELKFVKAFDMY